MSNVKKLMMTAASGGEPVNVEDVFSTFTWVGNSKPRNINNGIALGNSPTGTDGSSTEFDGSTDWLSKSSDLTGNSDGKTFTCSFWVYVPTDLQYNKYVYHTSDSWRNTIQISSSGGLYVNFWNTPNAAGTAFEIQAGNACAPGTWNHVLFSADLTNTSLFRLYVNDAKVPSPGSTQANLTIDWTRSAHYIGYDATGASTGRFEGNLAHFYLDYTARDLDTESNRRLFINSAGGATSVATQSALNPILYLPMTSGYTVGENEGTGGNFSANGTPTIVTNNGVEADEAVGQGGMVLIKNRDNSSRHWFIHDTERGPFKAVYTNQTWAEGELSSYLTSFNRNGFNIGSSSDLNYNNEDICSWTFRKAPKFFDVVTYTGTGSTRTVSHNLGSVPGCIIIKETSSTRNWYVYHRSMGNTKYMYLNTTDAEATASTAFNNTSPTSTEFTVGTINGINNSGQTYVAYLFAHNNNDGEFGPEGDQDIIKCDSYTGNGSSDGPEINLGWEPQFVFIKCSNRNNGSAYGGGGFIFDNLRGVNPSGTEPQMQVQEANAEAISSNIDIKFTPTGFKMTNTGIFGNLSGATYTYIAIRRGPMAIPTSADDVFEAAVGDGAAYEWWGTGKTSGSIYTDFWMGKPRIDNSGYNWVAGHRISQKLFYPSTDNAEDGGYQQFNTYDTTSGFKWASNWVTTSSGDYLTYHWKRAPHFFDMTTYTGDGTNNQTFNHNLGIKPSMIWLKNRSRTATNSTPFWVWVDDNITTTEGKLSSSDDFGSQIIGTVTDSTVQTLYTNQYASNYSGDEYIAFLFGEIDGISKVGTFTYSGSSINIDCGFSNGAKFVLLKTLSVAGNWLVFDTTRGIVAGNDPFVQIDSNVAESNSYDVIDPYSAGFTVAGALSSSNYMFYAVAA